FGGHTALFGCVVSQPFRVGLQQDDGFARLLLDHGADPNARASLRKRLRFVEDETMHEYRDVTPLAWGERFHDRAWVNESAMRLIAERSQRTRASGPSGLM
ncbi:MAG TPA: ankyrin repeat domain-containing protein, partial [Thermoanaerobaculia bacterium]|nr:ankyrin repeat domain-containing protein [Thermoanaerobaculia bacterium]